MDPDHRKEVRRRLIELTENYRLSVMPLQNYAIRNTRLSPVENRQLGERISQAAKQLTDDSRRVATSRYLTDEQRVWAMRAYQAIHNLSRLTEPRAIHHHQPLSNEELALIQACFRGQKRAGS